MDNYRKSSAKCLAIGFCLYIVPVITFHNNSSEAKIANELITSVQSLNIQLSHTLFPGLHVWPNLGCYRLFMCGLQFWSITFVINVESKQQGILTDIVHGCSDVTYPYLMNEDFFSLRILHENSLRLPYQFQLVMICSFSVFRIFPTGNEGKCQIALDTM